MIKNYSACGAWNVSQLANTHQRALRLKLTLTELSPSLAARPARPTSPTPVGQGTALYAAAPPPAQPTTADTVSSSIRLQKNNFLGFLSRQSPLNRPAHARSELGNSYSPVSYSWTAEER